jgi:hypothetical protein
LRNADIMRSFSRELRCCAERTIRSNSMPVTCVTLAMCEPGADSPVLE